MCRTAGGDIWRSADGEKNGKDDKNGAIDKMQLDQKDGGGNPTDRSQKGDNGCQNRFTVDEIQIGNGNHSEPPLRVIARGSRFPGKRRCETIYRGSCKWKGDYISSSV